MTRINRNKPLFPLGQIVITANARDTLNETDVCNALGRHTRGDWGDLCDEDIQENEMSLAQGWRLFSVYHATDSTRFWIITEADRSSTCVLLPEDY